MVKSTTIEVCKMENSQNLSHRKASIFSGPSPVMHLGVIGCSGMIIYRCDNVGNETVGEVLLAPISASSSSARASRKSWSLVVPPPP